MIPGEIVITHRIFIGRRYNNFSFLYEKWVKDIPDWDDLLLGDYRNILRETNTHTNFMKIAKTIKIAFYFAVI